MINTADNLSNWLEWGLSTDNYGVRGRSLTNSDLVSSFQAVLYTYLHTRPSSPVSRTVSKMALCEPSYSLSTMKWIVGNKLPNEPRTFEIT